MKKANQFINCVMGGFFGVLIGRMAAMVWDYLAHPQRYAAQSAPWYTGILMHGAWTAAALFICIILKAILKRCMKRKEGERGG